MVVPSAQIPARAGTGGTVERASKLPRITSRRASATPSGRRATAVTRANSALPSSLRRHAAPTRPVAPAITARAGETASTAGALLDIAAEWSEARWGARAKASDADVGQLMVG